MILILFLLIGNFFTKRSHTSAFLLNDSITQNMYCDLFCIIYVFWNVIYSGYYFGLFAANWIWKESEDGVLDISIKLYVKKDTHMVSWFFATLF